MISFLGQNDPIKALRAVRGGIRTDYRSIGGGNRRAEIGPVGLGEIGGVLQLVCLARHGAPNQRNHAACLGDGLEKRRKRKTQAEDCAIVLDAAAIGGAVKIAVAALHHRGGRTGAKSRTIGARERD